MPAYNFKMQFAGDVETGRKRQTIRPRRKRQTKPGDTLYLYTGMRTKQCWKLGEEICLSVQPIEIEDTFVRLDGITLGVPEMSKLARADGFASLGEFYDFFSEHYRLPFRGELIKW
jgi:hypothetical protein